MGLAKDKTHVIGRYDIRQCCGERLVMFVVVEFLVSSRSFGVTISLFSTNYLFTPFTFYAFMRFCFVYYFSVCHSA